MVCRPAQLTDCFFYVISSYDYMLQLLMKLKAYTKLGPETVPKYSQQNLLMIICILPAPTKVFLQFEHHNELLLPLRKHYQE